MKQIEIENRIFRLKDDDAIYYCVDTLCDYYLNVRCIYYIQLVYADRLPDNWQDKNRWRALPKEQFSEIDEIFPETTLNGDYVPAAELKNGFFMNLLTPDAQDEYVKVAKQKLIKAVGNVAEFVAERCQYSLNELKEVLSLEQIDSIAFAIYNSEVRKQGFIVGDMTGVGKGRIAAVFLRYAMVHGYKPVFFTASDELFVDLYRDLKNTHNLKFKPFIINENVDVTDPDTKKVIFERPTNLERKEALRTRRLPEGYDFALCTYQQLGDCVSYKGLNLVRNENKSAKNNLIKELCANSYIVCDESHTVGGNWARVPIKDNSTNTIDKYITKIQGYRAWVFFAQILPLVRGIVYLSATFAKRPDNMPNYAINTCLSDVMSAQRISNLFRIGGVAVQEIVSAALVEYGQMLRREHRNEGVNTDIITINAEGTDKYGVTDQSARHRAIYTKLIYIMNKIRKFELDYLEPYFAKKYPPIKVRKKDIDVPMTRYRVRRMSMFNFIFDLLDGFIFSLKAEDIAERAIKHLKEGKKVVIGFSNTFESLYRVPDTSEDDDDDDDDENGENEDNLGKIDVKVGTKKKWVFPPENTYFERTDFVAKFRNIFDNLTRFTLITVVKKKGEKRTEATNRSYGNLADDMSELENFKEGAIEAYEDIKNTIRNASIGVTFSPIDVIKKRIESTEEHFKVAESTGRKYYIEYTDTNCVKGVFKKKPETDVSQCYDDFNNNKADVLLINATGSTGKSAHAVPTPKVPESEVKQRIMLIGQTESDINVEVQKRGRINRTGQVKLPAYEYIFSDIPCERKMAMMTRRKLKSLMSNTSSDQNANEDLADVDDFDNIYGEWAVDKYLDMLRRQADDFDVHSREILRFLGDMSSDIVKRLFSRMQALPIEDQEEIWDFVTNEYNRLVADAKIEGSYFLECQEKQFDAKLIDEYCLYEGDNENSRLTASTFIGHYDIKSQKQLTSEKDLKKDDETSKNILKNIKKGYENELANLDGRKAIALGNAKTRLDEQISKLQEKVATKQQKYDIMYDDDDVSPEKLKAAKEELKALKEELKEKQGNYDKVLKEQENEIKEEYAKKTAEVSDKFKRLSTAVENFNIGSVFEDGKGIYYLVTDITAPLVNEQPMWNEGEDVLVNRTPDLFSSPSNIIVTFVSTDATVGNSLVRNLAPEGLQFLEDTIIKGCKKSTLKKWEEFIRSSKFREKVYIVTGNIIRVINGINKGTIIKFTKADGTSEVGFLVKMRKNERTGLMELPDTFDGVQVNIEGNEPKIKSALAQGGTFELVCDQVEYGECSIYGERKEENDMQYILKMSSKHNDILGLKSDYISGDYFHTVENLDNVLMQLVYLNYKIKLPFNLLSQYGLTLRSEKFKMQDWQPLAYDKNKIPKK